MFQGEKVIRDIGYTGVEQDGDMDTSRRVIFDIHCTGENGEKFIIEMQKVYQDFFKDRMIFYTSRLVSNLVEKGRKGNSYYLPEVYFIGLLEFPLGDRYFHDVALREKETGALFYKLISLPNFKKRGPELDGIMDQWFYTLKHLSRMKEMSKYLDPKVIGRMFDIGRIGNLNKEQLMEYQASMKDKMDLEAAFSGAMKQGRERGRKEGKAEGKVETMKTVIRNLILEFDMSDKEIAKATSQSPAFVREMRRSIEQESRE